MCRSGSRSQGRRPLEDAAQACSQHARQPLCRASKRACLVCCRCQLQRILQAAVQRSPGVGTACTPRRGAQVPGEARSEGGEGLVAKQQGTAEVLGDVGRHQASPAGAHWAAPVAHA